jgi:hypothetical protein
MGLRIPQNQIVKSKYTAGKEYMFALTQKEYIGYYYELNNKIFAGEEFNTNAPILVKITPANTNGLLAKAATYIYGRISKSKLNQTKIISLPSSTTTNLLDRTGELFLKFFCQKINQSPIIIKEIDEEIYESLQKDPLYKTTFIGTYNGTTQSIEEANKQMPGLEGFLQG